MLVELITCYFKMVISSILSLRWIKDRLRALPSFRRLAFEEIHAAGHWGRKLSGGGSSKEITVPLANHLLKFLQTAPGWNVTVSIKKKGENDETRWFQTLLLMHLPLGEEVVFFKNSCLSVNF